MGLMTVLSFTATRMGPALATRLAWLGFLVWAFSSQIVGCSVFNHGIRVLNSGLKKKIAENACALCKPFVLPELHVSLSSS